MQCSPSTASSARCGPFLRFLVVLLLAGLGYGLQATGDKTGICLIGHPQSPLNVSSFLVQNLVEPLNNADLFVVSPNGTGYAFVDSFLKNGHDCVEHVFEDRSQHVPRPAPPPGTRPHRPSTAAPTVSEGERFHLWHERTRKFSCSRAVVRTNTTRVEHFEPQPAVFTTKQNDEDQDEVGERPDLDQEGSFNVFLLDTCITDPYELLDFYSNHTGGATRKLLEAGLGRVLYGWRPSGDLKLRPIQKIELVECSSRSDLEVVVIDHTRARPSLPLLFKFRSSLDLAMEAAEV